MVFVTNSASDVLPLLIADVVAEIYGLSGYKSVEVWCDSDHCILHCQKNLERLYLYHNEFLPYISRQIPLSLNRFYRLFLSPFLLLLL